MLRYGRNLIQFVEMVSMEGNIGGQDELADESFSILSLGRTFHL